jgi:hypothetical protein
MSPLTELECAIYREPLSPSAPFIGTTTASRPRALLTIDPHRHVTEATRRAAMASTDAAAAHVPGQEHACVWAAARGQPSKAMGYRTAVGHEPAACTGRCLKQYQATSRIWPIGLCFVFSIF